MAKTNIFTSYPEPKQTNDQQQNQLMNNNTTS